MTRRLYLVYAVGCYLLFLATYGYLAGFLSNFLVPKSIDAPASSLPLAAAVAINVGLLLLFGAQHSVMARPAFKRVWTRFVPQPIERATYVLLSCVVVILLLVLWQPLPGVVWHVKATWARATLWTLFAVGLLGVPAVSLLINHFDLFGLRQVWLHMTGRDYTALPFREPSLYRHVRHPLYVAWAVVFWTTPTMSWGHLLFAGVWTAYMLGAAVIEERDLIAHFGHHYQDYRRRVPMFVPRLRPVRAAADNKGQDPAAASTTE